MDWLRELLSPTKKKLIVFVFILLSSSFIIYGNLSGDITIEDQDRPGWINGLFIVWSIISVVGSIFQGPWIFLSQFLPANSDSLLSQFYVPLALVNSYIQASLIGKIWEIKKTDRERNYLRIYVAGVIGIFLWLMIKSVGESYNDAPQLIAGGFALLLLVYFTKRFVSKIFKPIILLTILLAFTFFGFAISDFEEFYCWNNFSGQFSDHMECHKKFDLSKAISEVYFK